LFFGILHEIPIPGAGPPVVIGIVDFKLFDCAEFRSEFRLLEVSRQEPLTNRISLHFFELPKVPELQKKKLPAMRLPKDTPRCRSATSPGWTWKRSNGSGTADRAR